MLELPRPQGAHEDLGAQEDQEGLGWRKSRQLGGRKRKRKVKGHQAETAEFPAQALGPLGTPLWKGEVEAGPLGEQRMKQQQIESLPTSQHPLGKGCSDWPSTPTSEPPSYVHPSPLPALHHGALETPSDSNHVQHLSSRGAAFGSSGSLPEKAKGTSSTGPLQGQPCMRLVVCGCPRLNPQAPPNLGPILCPPCVPSPVPHCASKTRGPPR